MTKIPKNVKLLLGLPRNFRTRVTVSINCNAKNISKNCIEYLYLYILEFNLSAKDIISSFLII